MFLFVWSNHFLDARAGKFFHWFFRKLKTPKIPSEISWPLSACLIASCLAFSFSSVHRVSFYQFSVRFGQMSVWGVHYGNIGCGVSHSGDTKSNRLLPKIEVFQRILWYAKFPHIVSTLEYFPILNIFRSKNSVD